MVSMQDKQENQRRNSVPYACFPECTMPLIQADTLNDRTKPFTNYGVVLD